MAWNIGANDLANAMGTSVGSGALTLTKVTIIAGVLELTGAVFFGDRVVTTVAKGIVPIGGLDSHVVALGALAAILSAGFWITLATYKNLPVSTTHSIVGAMTGFGLAAATTGLMGIGEIEWAVLVKIVMSWIISPLLGGALAFTVFWLVKRCLLSRVDDVDRLEHFFGFLQIGSAMYVALAHGSNDVANAVGPLAAALQALGLVSGGEIPTWVLLVGGLGIVIGLATWGYKVIETIGHQVTELTPTRGFSAEFATATVVIMHSYSALPISTTHVLVGSVIGVGLAGGLEAVDLDVIGKIIFSWIITVPIAAALSAVLYFTFVGVGL